MGHINKQCVVEMLRERVQPDCISVWMGVPLSEFDKDELIMIINALGRDLTATRRQHMRDLDNLI